MKNTTFYLKGNDIENFRYYLQERESSKATIEKYIRDVKRFTEYAGKHTRIDKEKLLEYKQWLVENYAISSANSMLVALNQFLIFLGKGSLRLKRIRTQRNDLLGVDKALEKQEFQKLVKTARGQGKEQIAMIMEAMCATDSFRPDFLYQDRTGKRPVQYLERDETGSKNGRSKA